MTIPTNQDFATEVKMDRLTTLWRVTLIGALFLAWIILNIAMMQRTSVTTWIVALGLVIAGCLVTRFLLKRSVYVPAVWVYALGSMIGIGVALSTNETAVLEVVPFTFPLLIFVVGLLLPPSNTFLASILATLITLLVPWASSGSWAFLGFHQIVAVILTFLSALLAAQVTGELYQVTEWALLNYQRERRTTQELFDNRVLLERSLLRSQALSERLQETNSELETARTAAEEAKHYRGQFLANMSHELRTPLNAIIGFSETMLKFPIMYDNVRLPDAYEADLNQIYTSGRQLLTLINDILDLAKVDAGKLEVRMDKVDVRPIISSVLSTAQGLIGKKPIKLEANVPEYLPLVWADDARVRQVLLNLYSNAAKFTDEGNITVSARETEEGVEISLKDSGSGIPKESLGLIFEEFTQADTDGRRDPRSGAGLGLTISRQLCTLMGGRIWAESEPGKGSTFYFVVQRYKEPVKTQDTTAPVASADALSSAPAQVVSASR
jgi:signal transduction histidine kinase